MAFLRYHYTGIDFDKKSDDEILKIYCEYLYVKKQFGEIKE